MLFQVPASQLPVSTIDPANFRGLRDADSISPAAAQQVQKVLNNLRLPIGNLYAGNVRMPLDQYVSLGGPAEAPIYIQFENQTSARALFDALNNDFWSGVTIAVTAFTAVQPAEVVGYLMGQFPEMKQALSDALQNIATKGL